MHTVLVGVGVAEIAMLALIGVFALFAVLRSVITGRFTSDLRRAQVTALAIVAMSPDRKTAMRLALENQRGSIDADWVIGALIVFLVAIYTIPVAITAFLDVDTSSWPTTLSGFWGFFPVLVLIGVVYGVYKLISKNSG